MKHSAVKFLKFPQVLLIGFLILAGYVWGAASFKMQLFPYQIYMHIRYGSEADRAAALKVKKEDRRRAEVNQTSEILSISEFDADFVFLGDSLTAAAQWHELFQGYNIANRGIGRNTVHLMYDGLDDVLSTNPETIFIMAGINDLATGQRPEDVFRTYAALLDRIRDKNIDVVVTGTVYAHPHSKLGENVRALNARLEDYAKTHNITYIEINNILEASTHYRDDVHLNASGYKIWRNALLSYIEAKN